MKKHLKLILLVSIFIFACSKGEFEGALDKSTMVSILIRLHIAEAKTGNSYLISDTLRIYYKSLEDSIFVRYGTSKEEFEKSYKMYMKNPTVIDKIYAEVVDSLSLREAIKKVD